jgi:hypothetical protein
VILTELESNLKRVALLLLQGAEVTPEMVATTADQVIGLRSDDERRSLDRERLIKAIEEACNVSIDAPTALEGEDDHVEWLADRRAGVEWRFWTRYRQYLEEVKDFAPPVVSRLDDVTDQILRRLEDPQRPGRWDRRGMVVGHVQSGKTANYSGLICKAIDAGYKLIVVLAGVHDSLRSQTQLRIDESVIGFDTQRRMDFDQGNTRIGVGRIKGLPFYHVHPLTSSAQKGDFRKTVAQQVGVVIGGQDPVVLVVKKHKSILENLRDWATSTLQVKSREGGKPRVPDVPLLVIDDECDHASVNTKDTFDSTGEFDPDVDPTAINGAIRKLLDSFEQTAYVGYTATPFANIFIFKDADTEEYGEDLFPRSFILSLKKSSEYVGADRVFGLNADPARGIDFAPALPIVRTVADADTWLPGNHKKTAVVSTDIPESLRTAMLSFVLACAARRARGETTAHNSMLIHVTRFTDVQAEVRDAIALALQQIKDRVEFGDGRRGRRVLEELRALWEDDFLNTTAEFDDPSLQAIPWADIEAELHPAASKIEIRVINGQAADALDYYERKTGLSVIAIGGDKLSRGLTLEGLTVSYYLRASKMYDTLLQMGRWFGYRPGYGDLCRLYTTSELQRWYKDITLANEELFQQFEEMALLGGTPNDFGLRVANSADGLLITARAKLRTGTKLKLSFSGSISETIMFKLDSTVDANLASTADFVAGLGAHSRVVRNNFVFDSVPADQIIAYLREFRTHPSATKAQARMLVTYIEGRLADGELEEWTVSVISNPAGPTKHPLTEALSVGTTIRAQFPDSEDPERDTYSIRRLLSPPDEALDLTAEEYEVALDKTKLAAARAGDDKPPPTDPSGTFVRRARPVSRGHLMIYLLDKKPTNRDLPPIVGLGLSFPYTEQDAAIEYTVNNVYWDEMVEA